MLNKTILCQNPPCQSPNVEMFVVQSVSLLNHADKHGDRTPALTTTTYTYRCLECRHHFAKAIPPQVHIWEIPEVTDAPDT